jgi:hypothetical protein
MRNWTTKRIITVIPTTATVHRAKAISSSSDQRNRVYSIHARASQSESTDDGNLFFFLIFFLKSDNTMKLLHRFTFKEISKGKESERSAG